MPYQDKTLQAIDDLLTQRGLQADVGKLATIDALLCLFTDAERDGLSGTFTIDLRGGAVSEYAMRDERGALVFSGIPKGNQIITSERPL